MYNKDKTSKMKFTKQNKLFKRKRRRKTGNIITRKNETRKAIRSGRWSFINKILLIGLNENNTKPFWQYVKSTKQENIGIAQLLQKDG